MVGGLVVLTLLTLRSVVDPVTETPAARRARRVVELGTPKEAGGCLGEAR